MLCLLSATSGLSVHLTPARSAHLVMCADAVHLTPDLLAADHGVRIAHSPGKGMGAFATQPWAAGLVVGDYEGEMITKAQFGSRYGDDPMTPADEEWLKSRTERGVSVTGEYIVKVHDDLYVDAEDPDVSSWCRFINHDARPNLALKVLPKGLDGKPRVWFTAKRGVAEVHQSCPNPDPNPNPNPNPSPNPIPNPNPNPKPNPNPNQRVTVSCRATTRALPGTRPTGRSLTLTLTLTLTQP